MRLHIFEDTMKNLTKLLLLLLVPVFISCNESGLESEVKFNEMFPQRFNGMNFWLTSKTDNSLFTACISDSSFLDVKNNNTFHLLVVGKKQSTGEKFRVEMTGNYEVTNLSAYSWGYWSGTIIFNPLNESSWGGGFEYHHIKSLPSSRFLLIKMWVFIRTNWIHNLSPQRFYPDYRNSDGC